MKTVYSDDHRHQDGKAELIDGKLLPCFEMPRRADMILARVKEMKLGEVLAPRDFGLDPVKRVHKAELRRIPARRLGHVGEAAWRL